LSKVDLRIDWATHEAAKYACENWHYSKCIPKSKLAKFGVWEDGIYKGVVIYGVGATSTLVQQYGLKPQQGCELVRIALKSHVWPVSKIMAITLKMLKKQYKELKLVVSFADSEEGHHGGIYQAAGWLYTGRSADCAFPIINGKKTHPRTLSLMVKSGKVKNRNDVPHIQTKGKYRYLMPLDSETRQKVLPLSKPYPKRVKQANSGDQLERGGAAPTYTLQSSAEVSNVSQTA
jgi:hypothetical protein